MSQPTKFPPHGTRHAAQRISGVYALTPDTPDTDDLLHRVRHALAGDVRLLQYRNKLVDAATRLKQARALRSVTREYGAILIINDDAELAASVDADGVHLGKDDGDISAARSIVGADRLIGVSCYNELERAREAVKAGADYVAFGAFYASSVKPDAAVAPLSLLPKARAELSVPVVAIGGITLTNGRELVSAGAHALAVISALFNAPDIELAARDFSRIF